MSKDLDELLKEAPTLTFDTVVDTKEEIVVTTEAKKDEPEKFEVVLTPEEQKMVDDFAAQIDLTNTQMVMQYGAGSQKKIADFSETALSSVRTKDMGEIGDLLTNVVAELKNFDEEEENVKEGRKKRRYKKRKSTKKETMITGKRTKRQYTRKKKVNSDETDVTNQNNNNEQDNKISISTSNTSNNTMNNVLFSTTAEVPFQEVIKPLPTNDAMLISSKTIGEDKNITGFNNQNKILLF